MNREWHISQALKSVRRLGELLPDLSVEELTEMLEIERGSLRRRTVLSRITARIKAIKTAEILSKLDKEST